MFSTNWGWFFVGLVIIIVLAILSIRAKGPLVEIVPDAQPPADNDHVAPGAQLFPETVTFDQFVQYGRDHGANIVNGMPWSFQYRGHAVTHENDRCYIIHRGGVSFYFTPDHVLLTNPDGSLSTGFADGRPVQKNSHIA